MQKLKLTVYIEPELADALRRAAEISGLPQGELVTAALRAALLGDGTRATTKKMLQSGPGAALVIARRLRADKHNLAAIADALNAQGYRTSRGRDWTVMAVSRLLRHAAPPAPPKKRTRTTR